jgi:HD-GYP domain-containing protein (c-di-GMP phosphodiesterase class II)
MPLKSVLPAVTAATSAAALLYRRERHYHRMTERLVAAALETLLNAIDANDADTGAHVRRVATYALLLAEAAGLADHEKKVVEHVALFHDIGKIHEALFDIVHDDKKLSAAERRAIATHPIRGAEVLNPLKSFYPELPAGVLSHHERWDGKGYPRHLKGRRIPVSARIVAIADTFDAVTHSRRYRPAQSIAAGRRVILEGRGTQFDPDLVDLFVLPPVFDRIVAAHEKMRRWPEPARQRSSGRDGEEHVPDITFRWRPARRGGPARRAPALVRRAAR